MPFWRQKELYFLKLVSLFVFTSSPRNVKYKIWSQDERHFSLFQWPHWIHLQLESKYVTDNWNMLEWKKKFKISKSIKNKYQRISPVRALKIVCIPNMVIKSGIFRFSSATVVWFSSVLRSFAFFGNCSLVFFCWLSVAFSRLIFSVVTCAFNHEWLSHSF